MKIVAIRGRNLASLESFDVALEEGPLSQVGIFAITGPTGSGKTTLLDALCVALFDRTPRLSNQAGVPVGHADQDESQRVRANDVRGLLRRGCGDGFAEVDFIGRDNRAFRARWEVRRARNSPTGKLQKTSMSLTCLRTHEITTGKKTETLKAIEECLGLSYEQFRRSALLAQNDFAAFLRANKDERSELLERMTGTEIYTRVSVAAFRRASTEAKSLELLEDSLDSSAILSDEERVVAELRRTDLRSQHKATSEKIKIAEGELRWFQDLRNADKQIEGAKDGQQRAIVNQAALEPTAKRLEQVQEARKHRSVVVTANRATAEAKSSLASWTLAMTKAKAAQTAVSSTRDSIATAEAAIKTARAEYVARLGLELQAARVESTECDEWLAKNSELCAAGGEVEEFVDLAASVLDGLRPDLEDEVTGTHIILRDFSKQSGEAKNAQTLAKKAASDASSRATKAGIDKLRQSTTSLRSRSKALEELLLSAERVRKSAQDAKTALALCSTSEQLMVNLGTRIEEIHSERAALELRRSEAEAAYDRIRLALDFGEQRTALRDDEECPLCGSLQHPWKDDALAVGLVGEQEARVNLLRVRLGDLERDIADARAKRSAAESALKQAANQSKDSQSECERATAKYAERWDPALGLSASLEDPRTEETERVLGEQLQQAGEALSEHEKLLTEAEQLDAVARKETAELARCQAEWERVRDQEQEAERSFARSRDRRSACDGYRYRARKDRSYECKSKIVTLETRVSSAREHVFVELDEALDQATKSHQRAAQEQVANDVRVQSGHERHEQAKAEQAESQGLLEDLLVKLSCTEGQLTEHLAVDDLWIKDSQSSLTQAASKCVEARTKVNERKARRTELAKQKPPALSEEGTGARHGELVDKLESITEEVMLVGASLKANTLASKRRDELGLKIKEAHERVRVFKILSDLIGSADGKKFRVFAQSLTLDTLLAGANQHLRDLAPRYALQRVPGHDLDIQVIDRDLADDVRSVNSLSGGESFLMSLALALGLSSLASRDIRVESLLVDEGFGSLDEETLEVALGVLDSLQATGRKVGLISHVHGFAERIGAQVVVRPIGGGCSTVEIQAGSGIAA